MKSSQTNTFTGGMQKDLHPMTTPNNVLTDALNATITTMNGNENVLQNDMGNARVESAYLPEGYIPIGMKEHGGIIYIASYNPVTEKGQVGSFPSPERNIENINGAGCVLNFNELLESKIVEVNGTQQRYNEIENYSIKYELEDGRIFHPGDMFNLVADLSKIPFTVTNQLGNNGVGDISLGLYVLDSSNNLVNITDSLNFYYSEDVGSHKKGDLIEDINNRYLGTFIKPLISNSESQVDGERSYTDYNTFNSKIAGKVYLIATLNSITSMDVDIAGEVEKEQDKYNAILDLNIDQVYTCPKENILPGIINIYKVDADNRRVVINYDIISNEFGKFKLKIKDFNPNENNSIFIEVIPGQKIDGVNANPAFTQINNLYSLKTTLEIDLNKLNSGEFKINTWRYYNNIIDGESRTNLVWGLEAYPKKSQKIKNLRFKFKNLLTGDKQDLDISGKKNYFGTFNESLDLTNKTLYQVQLYKVLQTDDTTDTEELIGERFILTTPLLNKCFFAESPDYLQDFGNIVENNKLGGNIYNKYHTVKMEGDSTNVLLKQFLPTTTEQPLEIIRGDNILSTVQNNKYTEQQSSYLVNYSPKLQNQKNYPFELDKQKVSIQLNVENVKAESEGSEVIYDVYNNTSTNINEGNNYIKYEVSDIPNTSLNKRIDFKNHLVSKFSGEYKQKSGIQVNTLFKAPQVDDLFGFGFSEKPWWLSSRTWTINEHRSSEETALGHILTYNALGDNKYAGSVVYKFFDTRQNGKPNHRISMDQDGGAVVYDKIVSYISKSKNKPTVALWSSYGNIKVDEDKIPEDHDGRGVEAWNGTGIANSDDALRTFGFEYVWWLGTDGQYYLLSNAIIPNDKFYIKDDQFSNKAKKTFTLQNSIAQALHNVFIGNTNNSAETKSLYILNPTTDKDLTKTVTFIPNIKVTPIIKSVQEEEEYFTHNNTQYWKTIKTNYGNEVYTNKQLAFFNFVLQTTGYSDLYIKDLNFVLESKGYEDELNTIQKINNNSEVSMLLETNDGKIFVNDSNGRELDVNKIYTIDENTKVKSIDTVPSMKNIYNTFTLGTNGYGNRSLLVRPVVTSKVEHTYYNWDQANDNTYIHFYFSDMPSFALPLSILSNTQSINARQLRN